jgi:hypothetical protein
VGGFEGSLSGAGVVCAEESLDGLRGQLYEARLERELLDRLVPAVGDAWSSLYIQT